MVIDAVEAIGHLAGQVARWIDEALAAHQQPGFDPAEPQSDGFGAAGMALCLIRESRQAWRILMEPGRATANGVPARLVDLLTRLEGATLERFPLAEAFVRPTPDKEA